MREELIHHIHIFRDHGLLKDPQSLALRDGTNLLSLYPSSDLDDLTVRDVQVSSLADIGPSFGTLDIFRQAMGARRSIKAVLLCQGNYTLAASSLGVKLPCLLDDTAQIIGPVIRCCPSGRVKANLAGVSSLLVRDMGGLCTAASLYDLEAAALILEKSCRVVADGWFLGKPSTIPWIQRLRMRWKYQNFYESKAHR